jgi:hypothetical protein
VRESAYPVAQVGRDLGTPDNVLNPWTSLHRQAEAHGTTRAYELYVERGCREGCTLSFLLFLLATTCQIIRAQLWTIKLCLMGPNYDLPLFQLATSFLE